MPSHDLITFVIFTSFFLFTTSLLHTLTRRFTLVPYTSALLLVGLIAQLLLKYLRIDVHLSLTPNTIFYVLLPLLLFESAMKINFHQFKLQFKTITFMATFGLMTSMLVVAFGLTYLLGLDFATALLFGAIISATDPIAVLALFKSLGAPQRLGLLAEGESMFNDATAVIAFRTLSVFALTGASFAATDILGSLGSFLAIFTGSIAFGAIIGYLVSAIIARIDNDRIVETTLTIALALTSFAFAEHFFHLSGVIAAVSAGITLGNLGRTKISGSVVEFMSEFWEYIGFLSISLVFFFATFNLDTTIFTQDLVRSLIVIVVVLAARALSTYLSFFFSNTLKFFDNEPNVPLSWQHIINWGGMRGVIPLVLVYALPDDFAYKQDFLSFTLAAFMFTLFVNGISIRWLMTALKIHLPKKEEAISNEEKQILSLEGIKQQLKNLPSAEFDQPIVDAFRKTLERQEQIHKTNLLELTTPEELENSLRLQTLTIEQDTAEHLFREGHINENVYFDLESELDLQRDALEHPEVRQGRAIKKGGRLDTNASFRKRLKHLSQITTNHPLLGKFLSSSQEETVYNRMMLLRTRILGSAQAIKHLETIKRTSHTSSEDKNAIDRVIADHHRYTKKNQKKLDQLKKEYPYISKEYQHKLLETLLRPHRQPYAH